MKFVDFIFFGRPMLLIPVWTVYLHYFSLGQNVGYFQIYPSQRSLYHLLALTLIMMGAYVFNQIFDVDSDRINDKLFFLPRGIISRKAAWIYWILLTISGFSVTVFSMPELIRPILVIIGLGVLYSVPGVRLKDNPIGGLVANSVGYGFLIPWIIDISDPGLYSKISMIPYFMAIAAGYILTTIPDHDGDVTAGKRTVAVILGPRGALWLALLTILATILASLWVSNTEMIIVAVITALCVIYLIISFRYRVLMFTCKFPLLLLTLFAGLHYLFYPALLLLTIILTKLYYKRRFGIIYPKLS